MESRRSAARAQDPGTVLTNPAGMARLPGSQILLGIQPLCGVLEFSPNGSTTTTGSDGGNAGLLWEPSKATRIGITYDSAVALDFSDTPQFSKRGPLAGRVAGDYPSTSMSFANINATWKF